MQDHQYHCFQTFPTLASAFARSALAPDPPRRLEDNWRACCSRDVSRLMVDGRRGILSCSNAEVCVVLLNKNVKNTDLSWLFPSIASKIIFISSPSTSSQNPVTNNFPAGLLPPKEHPLKGKVPKRNLFGCFLARATQEENYNLSPPIRICPCRLAAFQHRLILA